MKHVISLALVLFALWLGLSGHMDPLLIGLGVASTLLAVYLALRMELIDREVHLLHLTAQLIKFWAFLSREIVLANIDVAKRILSRGPDISPQLVELPLPYQHTLSKVIYANAITLTPGTVSVRVADTVLVHALSRDGIQALAKGDMARAVPGYVEPPDA